LIPHDDAVEALKCRNYIVPLLTYELELADKLNAELKIAAAADVATERKRGDSLNKLLMKAMAPVKWYDSPVFWFVIGAATTVTIVLTVKHL